MWDGAKWNEPGNTQGINDGEVRALAPAWGYTDANCEIPLFVGGTFTQVRDGGGGLLTYSYIATWTPTLGWQDICSSGDPTAAILTLAWDSTNKVLYAGGGFSTINGVAANRVAKYDPATGVWSALGSGTGTVYVYTLLYHTKTGYLYAGGDFITADGSKRVQGQLQHRPGRTGRQRRRESRLHPSQRSLRPYRIDAMCELRRTGGRDHQRQRDRIQQHPTSANRR